MKPLNHIVSSTPPSGIRKFFDIAAEMEGVITLAIGEPDFVTPWHIRDAAISSLERGETSYTSNSGLPALREAICAHLFGRYGVKYDPKEEVVVTVGVSEALDIALRALLNPGDEVIVPDPGYVSYQPCVSFAGGKVVTVGTRGEEGFRLHASDVEAAITERTKAILLCYPNNPTGATQTREDLQELVNVAIRHDLYIISDEIYDRLSYNTNHTCIASLDGARERTLTLNGFSKSYAMTGWRVGYACAPAHIMNSLLKIHQYAMLCAASPSQYAALQALKQGEMDVRKMVVEYDQRRRLMTQRLNSIGLRCVEPEGAFYAFPSIASTGMTSEQFAEKLLYEERVAVVPGNAFGASGEGYVRCCYATSPKLIEEALDRMARFMQRNLVASDRSGGVKP